MLKQAIALLLVTVIFSQSLLRHDLVDWKFKIPSKYQQTQYPAKIPSNIHIDLLQNNLIPDPFYRDNQNSIKWIHTAEVLYETRFKLPTNWENVNQVQLVFEGLDTYANITLNGQVIKITNNSFIKYTIPVNNMNNQQNILQIWFSPSQPLDVEHQKQTRLPFPYGHSRKAPYQYGWDWAPEMITVGIWRPAYILGFQKARIDYVWARNRIISSQKAVINFATVVHKVEKSNTPASPTQSIPIFNISVLLEDKQLGHTECKQTQCYIDITIPEPKLWWPRSVGTPNMYNFTVQLKSNNKVIDSKKVPYGIRTIQLNQTKGAFQFIVNGYPVYSKGGNYVPADMFHPRFANPVHKPVYTVQQLFSDIAESNINMIRIWGGGQYETDQFYELASRNGIMLFSDFMFSVNTYPGSEQFLRNCEEEAKQQIRRMRNYPALALWSGNNEVLQGILSWGWGSSEQKKNYDLLFEKLLRRIVEIQNPDINYIASSPNFGSGYDTSKGDIHSWSVWAGGNEFQSYLTTVGRFNSQFGTQAFPVWQTVKQFTQEGDRNYESVVMKGHEKHSSQFNNLRKYHQDYFRNSNSFQNQVYISGLTQAYAIRLAISAHRVAKNSTWGTLYWQLNDAWPVISWAAIDYYGRWKPLQYLAKNFFKDVALFIQSFDNRNSSIQYIAVNDKLQDIRAIVKIKVISFSGQLLFNETKLIDLKPNQAQVVHTFSTPFKDLIKQHSEKEVVFYGEIISSKTNIMSNTFTLGRPKDIELKEATLTIKYNTDTNQIKFSTNQYIRSLYISHPDKYIKLSDNYIDILPGIQSIVKLPDLAALKDKLQYKSVLQSYSSTPLNIKMA